MPNKKNFKYKHKKFLPYETAIKNDIFKQKMLEGHNHRIKCPLLNSINGAFFETSLYYCYFAIILTKTSIID
jgi:hypothetical protein